MDINRICLRCMNGEIGAGGICNSCSKPQLTAQSHENAIPLKTVIHGRYIIGDVLGRGGFGITYAAYDLKENHRIVIKEFFPSFLSKRAPDGVSITPTKDQGLYIKYRDFFVNEARITHTFRNTPEIVNVFHIFIENETAYYTMEYLVGETLYKRLKVSNGKMSWDQLKPIVTDIINALRVVHKSGNVHRDISPDNIFMTNNGVAKLIDFGAARNFNTGRGMTQIIKKGFAPIEQYKSDGALGPWTDIYAFAATIYYCLTGKMVPEATARMEKDTIRRPTELGAKMPTNVEQAIMQALSVRANLRFRSIDAFAGALQIYLPKTKAAPGVAAGQTERKMQLRCINGKYAGMKIPFDSNIVVGRDSSRCTLVFPIDMPGVSAVHLTLLYGGTSSLPVIRCESKTQPIYINGALFSGQGNICKLKAGDRISFGDNQLFVLENI